MQQPPTTPKPIERARAALGAPGMSLPLRSRILLFTVIPLLALGAATVWVVGDQVNRQARENLHSDLARAGLVFEQLLRARADQLAESAQGLALSPRFLSAWLIPEQDPTRRSRLYAAAAELKAGTHLDLLEVYDRAEQRLASAGAAPSARPGRTQVISTALGGTPAFGVVLRSDSPYQVAAVPVVVAGRPVGALLVGEHLGEGVAQRLALLTRTQVTFVTDRVTRASTLGDPEDRYRLIEALRRRNHGLAGARDAAVFELEGAHQAYVTLARPFPGAPAGLSYALQRSMDEETLFLRRIHRSMLGLELLALLAALATGLLVARSVTRPIRELVRAAEELNAGHYDSPLNTGGRDEIGYLARSFDGMRRNLRDYVTGLEEIGRLKSEFLTLASHELRTPVSIIQGYQALLADRALGPLTQPQDSAVTAIGKGTQSLLRLAEDASRLAEMDHQQLDLELREQDLATLLEQASSGSLGAAPGRRVEVHWSVEPGAERATVDGARLFLALSNLIQNGIRFTPDGGRVMVHARREDAGLEIVVRDTGIGIPRAQLAHIFDRSFAVRDSSQHHSSGRLEFGSAGLGLGLCIARGIIEAHGGDIRVQSAEGQGTEFTILLPDCRMSAAA